MIVVPEVGIDSAAGASRNPNVPELGMVVLLMDMLLVMVVLIVIGHGIGVVVSGRVGMFSAAAAAG